MYTNVGGIDRIVRILVGIIAVTFAVVQFANIHYLIAYLLVLFGILAFVTGVVGWSPTYAMLNYSTRKRGVEKITLEEIQRAVKENQVPKADPIEKLKPIKASSLASTNSKTKKSATTSGSKTKKKASTKKTTKASTTKKTVTKKAPAKKKTVPKKKMSAKKNTTKKSVTKKTATKKVTAKKKTSSKKK